MRDGHSDAGVRDLVMGKKAVARRYGDGASRLGQSDERATIRRLRAGYVAAFGGDGSHARTALRCRCASRGPVKGGRPIAARECGYGSGR